MVYTVCWEGSNWSRKGPKPQVAPSAEVWCVQGQSCETNFHVETQRSSLPHVFSNIKVKKQGHWETRKEEDQDTFYLQKCNIVYKKNKNDVLHKQKPKTNNKRGHKGTTTWKVQHSKKCNYIKIMEKREDWVKIMK